MLTGPVRGRRLFLMEDAPSWGAWQRWGSDYLAQPAHLTTSYGFRQKKRDLRPKHPQFRGREVRPFVPTPLPWSRQAQAKFADSNETESTFSKASHTVRRPRAQGASCLRPNPNHGQGFATRLHTGESVHNRIPHTSIWTERTSRILTRMPFCSIEDPPQQCQGKTACE